ncbi:hypothetical protein DER45DRAFT_618850 [Fusarium avenaceum]|nr:hypothetical protein DER45DRAFT_618850 [Fusarium avenaceum]
MKTAIFLTALISAAIAAPAANPVPAADVSELDARGSCPAGQNCVSGYCSVFTCVPAGTSTQRSYESDGPEGVTTLYWRLSASTSQGAKSGLTHVA